MTTKATAYTLVLLAGCASAALAAPLVKQLTIDPGKGVSFYMGSQQGTALFTQETGACGLSVSFAQNAIAGMSGMSGMSGGMDGGASAKAATLKIQVLPGRPAHLTTPDGQQLAFNCGPEGKQMFLEIPDGFKYTN